MRMLAFTIAVLFMALPALPAQACRIPTIHRSIFEAEPRPPAAASAYRGRLLTSGADFETARARSYGIALVGWSLEQTLLSDLRLFGVLQGSDGSILRVYKNELLLSCDNLFAHPLTDEVWIVGRPLPDDGQGKRVTMLAFRGGDRVAGMFQPLPETLLAIHRRLKQTFDPAGILNPGRLYPDF